MPVHDFQCRLCGAQILDRYQPRLELAPPPCPEGCVDPGFDSTMQRLWSTSNTVRFRPFDLHVPGRGTVTVRDIHQLRRIERASEGTRQPIAVRQYSMDHGQGPERNCFGPPPNQHVNPRTKRGELIKYGPYRGD